MPRPRSFRSSYEIMYLVPSYLFDTLKSCLNTAQKHNLQHLNEKAEEGGIKGIKPTAELSKDILENQSETMETNPDSNLETNSDPNPIVEEEEAENEIVQNEEPKDEIADMEDEGSVMTEISTPIPSTAVKCSVCGGIFGSKSDLAMHKVSYHPIPKRVKKTKQKSRATSGTHAVPTKNEPKQAKRFQNNDAMPASATTFSEKNKKRKSIFDDEDDESEPKRLKVSVQNKPAGKIIKQTGRGLCVVPSKKKNFQKWF